MQFGVGSVLACFLGGSGPKVVERRCDFLLKDMFSQEKRNSKRKRRKKGEGKDEGERENEGKRTRRPISQNTRKDVASKKGQKDQSKEEEPHKTKTKQNQ